MKIVLSLLYSKSFLGMLAGVVLSTGVHAGVPNGDFASGLTNWTITGGNTSTTSSAVRLGTTSLAGCVLPDVQNYSDMGAGRASSGLTGDETPTSWNSVAQVVQTIAGVPAIPGSGNALQLSFTGQSRSYGVVHGPAATSDTFSASAGDVLTFDWYPKYQSDDFAVVAYLVNNSDCTSTTIISATGSTLANMVPAATGSGWQNATVAIPSNGSYKFVFVNGSFDRTGGRALGSYLYIANIASGQPQTISFTQSAVAGSATLNGSASSGLAVSYTSTTPSVCTVSGNVVSVVSSGACTITASQAGGVSGGLTYVQAAPVTVSFAATFSQAGACGSGDGQSYAYIPSANLCSAGSASSVTSSSGQYSWTCNGTGGAANASCTASWASTGGGGSATGSVSVPNTGNNNWLLGPAGVTFVAATGSNNSPSTPPPSNYTFPQGLATFDLVTGTPGTDATVTIQYTEAIPAGAVYMKYGKTASSPTTDVWYQLPADRVNFSSDRMSVTLRLTDGGVGDHDLIANQVIQDPGGPAVISATQIPTLSEWAMIFMASLMAMFGIRRMRRQ